LYQAYLLLLLLQVQAERVAWQLAEQLGLDVVTILPNFVLVSRQQHCSTHTPTDSRP
jgi:predicted RecB family endonuclease